MATTLEKIQFKCRKWYKKLIGKPEKIFIYSYGGSGTRTFYEFVKQYKKVNGQSNVHWDLVESLKSTERVVYLYSNPVSAVKSFYRKDNEDKKFIKEHCRNLRVNAQPPPTLSEYARGGKDDFKLYDHFRLFVKENNSYDILLVRFENVWENLDVILQYMGLNKKLRSQFPPKKVRKGDLIELSDDDLNKLEAIYHKMNVELDKYPNVFLKKSQQQSNV